MTELPAKSDDVIVDVQLKHIVATLFVIAGGSFLIGASILAVKDYLKFKRQKAMLDTAVNVILLIKNGGPSDICKEQKTDTLSPTMTSEKPETSSDTLELGSS